MVREVNAGFLWMVLQEQQRPSPSNMGMVGMELQHANGGRFEVNQRLFSDDTAIVADSEEKL